MNYILLSGSSGAIGKEIKKFLLRKKENILELDLLGNPSVDATNEKSVKTARDTFSEHRYQREANKMNINRIIDQTSPNSNKNKKKENSTMHSYFHH